MNIKYVIYVILTFALFSCSGSENDGRASIVDSIEKLESVEQKKVFLEQVMQDDQAVRGSVGSELILKYGQNSDEHYAFFEAQVKQDEINLQKVEQYLKIHGYPNRAEMGETAANAPWTVIHHAQGYEARERNIKSIYLAYLDGNIESFAITLYLGRMYEMKNGKRLRMKSPYTAEDEITTLIRELNLEGLF